MIANYFTLKALIQEWQGLKNSVLAELFTQTKDELSIALGTPTQDYVLKVLAKPDFFGVFLQEGYTRARKNTADLFKSVGGNTVEDLQLQFLDRIIALHLSDGSHLEIHLYPPRPNVFWVQNGVVQEAFLYSSRYEGLPLLKRNPKPLPDSLSEFTAHFEHQPISTKSLRGIFPIFSEHLAQEALFRCAHSQNPEELWHQVQSILTEINAPQARIYEANGRANVLSLVPLHHLATPAETFASVGLGVRIFCQKKLSEKRFLQQYQPLEKVLAASVQKVEQQTEHLFSELAKPSRATQYEQFGHLLMAHPKMMIVGDKVLLDNFYEEGKTEVPVDINLSVIENAERYYEKARKSRQARQNAEARSFELLEQVEQGKALLENLRKTRHYSEVEAFKKTHEAALKPYIGSKSTHIGLLPYRQFILEGYEILVGRHAKGNDELTFKIARKFDLWLHARDVTGAHVIIKRTNPKQRPPQSVIEFAAALAAGFSQAKTSGLVAVQMTERKHVRKPKTFLPGAVLVAHEEVILIEPWKGN